MPTQWHPLLIVFQDPADDRLILRWHYWDGLSYAEVSRLSGLRENSEGPALSRARGRLKEILDKGEKEKGARI